MFPFRRFPSYTYEFSIWYHNMTYGGLLHSVIPGSKSAYDSPRHFVVSHDLLRLPMPRHSLCALCSLTIELCFDSRLNFEIVVIYPKIFSWIFDSFPHLHLLSLFSFQDTSCFKETRRVANDTVVFAFSLRELLSLSFRFVCRELFRRF